MVGPAFVHWLGTVLGKLNRMAGAGLERRLELTGAETQRG